MSVKKIYRFNQAIRSPKVRLVATDTNEVLDLSQALKKALAVGLDLVEVGAQADPPVVKMVDRKKFLYQEAKRSQKTAKTRKSKLKEIRLSPIIAANDFEIKINRGKEFLAKGDQLRVNLLLRGRLASRPELATVKMAEALKLLESSGKLLAPPKWQGRYLLVATLAPK